MVNGLAPYLPFRVKINGATNFNHIAYLALNHRLFDEYLLNLKSSSVNQLALSYLENLWIYFFPSSRYTEHAIVDRLPWRSAFDRIFSFPILPGLLFIFGMRWLVEELKKQNYAELLALFTPGLFIFLISVLFEKGENMRFKFFLEPVFFVFLVSQIFKISRPIQEKLSPKRTRRTPNVAS